MSQSNIDFVSRTFSLPTIPIKCHWTAVRSKFSHLAFSKMNCRNVGVWCFGKHRVRCHFDVNPPRNYLLSLYYWFYCFGPRIGALEDVLNFPNNNSNIIPRNWKQPLIITMGAKNGCLQILDADAALRYIAYYCFFRYLSITLQKQT